jgi:DNA-binding Lrp family transcriptional regulator
MDELDRKIIKTLKSDSRTSYVDLGKVVGLSEAAVRRRVQNLVKRKIIKKFTVDVDIGGASAITLLTVNSLVATQQVSLRLQAVKGVDIVHEITGQYDVAVIMSAPNVAEVNKCIDDIRKVEGVNNTNTVIILRTLS